MSEQPEAKKRRIIHWDPEHGSARQQKKWTPLRILGWTVGGFFALLLTAGLVIRGIKLVAGPDVFSRSAVTAKSGPTAKSAGDQFVSQSRAELSRETAGKALAELQKLPLDHDSLVQRFVLIQKAMMMGDGLLESHNYAKAYELFAELNRQIDAFTTDVRLKGETQKAYDEVLSRIKDLDMARSLTPEEFEKAFTDAGAGRQLFMQGSFVMAKKEFDRAFAALDRAQAALQAYVDDNLRKGQEAVAAGQRDAALAAFRAALEKDPANEAAQQGLKRADVADRVHSLLQQAAEFEEKKEYAKAAESYGKAFAVDSFSGVAQQGKARAERLEKETAFNGALAAAVAARAQKDWPKAIAEYERALQVDPKKDDVKKALAEVRDTAHKESVKRALAKGFEYENKYEWENARHAYYETIKLDPDHAEAKDGYTRSGRILRLLLQYDKLIEIAEQHAQKAEFATGIRLFNEAVSIKPAYLPLSDKVQQLRDTLIAQSQPMAVTFQSDGDTWVSITNFKMLGKIRAETLNILPGDYEIIGRRKGYQDVILMLQVRQGTPPPVVNVVCRLRNNS